MFIKNTKLYKIINYSEKIARLPISIHISLFGLVVWVEWCNFVGEKLKIIAK